MNTNGGYSIYYPCNTFMLNGCLQCETQNMQCRGTFFYMIYFIYAWNSQDINTSINDIDMFILISTT